MDKQFIPTKKLAEFIKLMALFNSSLELDEVMSNIMEKTAEVLEAEASSLLLLNQKDDRLYFHTATGKKGNELKSYSMEPGKGIVGWVAKNGQALLVPDVAKDKRFDSTVSTMLKFKTKAILCVPLKSEDTVIGVLELVNKKDGTSFSTDDLYFLETIATHATAAIENAVRHGKLSQENDQLREELSSDMVGQSPEMKKVRTLLEKVSTTTSTLLIRGGSGTGKEVAARTVHNLSPRKHEAFVCVTCAHYGEHLLESELFGHVKGAFTGATEARAGRFELADKGTVFLDEIGTVAPATQVKLLRFLQEKEFERVGSTKTIRSDVRIIAATNEDLEKAIAEGRFREDLYYRLKVIEINLPDLCQRKEDIPLLAEHFIRKVSRECGKTVKGIDPAAMQSLQSYKWPGNIRELKNVMERAVVLSSTDKIIIDDLPFEITAQENTETGTVPEGATLKDMERHYVRQVLNGVGGNKSQAARILGISRNRLERKLQEN